MWREEREEREKRAEKGQLLGHSHLGGRDE